MLKKLFFFGILLSIFFLPQMSMVASAVAACTGNSQCSDGAACLAGECVPDLVAPGTQSSNKGFFGLDNSATKAGYITGDEGAVLPVLNRVVGIALGAAALMFFAMALYAGIRWLTARGSEELVSKARNALQAAIFGLIIVVASYAIATFVTGKLFTTPSPTNSSIGGEVAQGCCTGLATGTGASAMNYCRLMNSFDECRQAGGNFVPGDCTGVSGC